MEADKLRAILDSHTQWIKTGGEKGEMAELTGANLKDADLMGVDLRGAILEGADLRGANLSCANLSWANLDGADLVGANLEGADLVGATLMGVNLTDYVPKLADNRKSNGVDQVHTELELMNMQLITLTAMLGEIAKRLPVPKPD